MTHIAHIGLLILHWARELLHEPKYSLAFFNSYIFSTTLTQTFNCRILIKDQSHSSLHPTSQEQHQLQFQFTHTFDPFCMDYCNSGVLGLQNIQPNCLQSVFNVSVSLTFLLSSEDPVEPIIQEKLHSDFESLNAWTWKDVCSQS